MKTIIKFNHSKKFKIATVRSNYHSIIIDCPAVKLKDRRYLFSETTRALKEGYPMQRIEQEINLFLY